MELLIVVNDFRFVSSKFVTYEQVIDNDAWVASVKIIDPKSLEVLVQDEPIRLATGFDLSSDKSKKYKKALMSRAYKIETEKAVGVKKINTHCNHGVTKTFSVTPKTKNLIREALIGRKRLIKERMEFREAILYRD